ncbi:phosphatidate cytidylyltransferase [Roseivirga sp.]|uniref:phosphatidate cytidylyltransferase n=1 Tax=Roseivirga sp. TaxID=1964215 RepID=UPI003B8BF8F5
MSNLATRAITALIGVAIIIGAIVYDYRSFAILFLILAILALNEFYGLLKSAGTKPFRAWGLVLSLVLFVLTFVNWTEDFEQKYLYAIPVLIGTLFILPLIRSDKKNVLSSVAMSILGVLYIVIPFCLVIPIAFLEGTFNYELVLGILFAQWANDTGAYFTGKTFGKTKLYEKISPNKTWEGAIGGLLIAVGILLIFGTYFNQLTTIEWVGLAIVVSVFGTIGDLVESLFKRTLAIKDSGSTLPGHGGFLDRFDGLILALPFAFAYLILIG